METQHWGRRRGWLSKKGASVVVQLVWFPAVMMLLLLLFSLKNPKSKVYVVDDHGYCEGRANTLYWLLPAGSELKHDSLIWENLLNKRLAEHCKSLPVGGRKKKTSHLQHTRTNQFLNSPVWYLFSVILSFLFVFLRKGNEEREEAWLFNLVTWLFTIVSLNSCYAQLILQNEWTDKSCDKRITHTKLIRDETGLK